MATPDQKAALQATVKEYQSTQYVNYLGLSGIALVVADFLHTFPVEVRLMWPTPLSMAKVLFFVVRYYILVHHVLAVLLSSILVVAASEGILFLRVYAFSGRNKKVLIFLVLQFIAMHASAFALLTRFLKTIRYVRYPIPNLVCMPSEVNSTLLGGVFAILLGSVVIAMLIMMDIAFRKHRDLNSTLITVFYGDGIFYFICLSALASANVLVNLAATDPGLKFLLVQTEVDIHAILSTRMLMHLREWAERDRRACCNLDTGTMAGAMEYSTAHSLRRPLSPLRFASCIESIRSSRVSIQG